MQASTHRSPLLFPKLVPRVHPASEPSVPVKSSKPPQRFEHGTAKPSVFHWFYKGFRCDLGHIENHCFTNVFDRFPRIVFRTRGRSARMARTTWLQHNTCGARNDVDGRDGGPPPGPPLKSPVPEEGEENQRLRRVHIRGVCLPSVDRSN